MQRTVWGLCATIHYIPERGYEESISLERCFWRFRSRDAIANMLIVHSRNGVPVRLTEERWQHIRLRHPEMTSQRERVIETLAEPEVIQEGDFGTLLAAHIYPHTPLTRKFLVVVYREVTSEDGFVVTAYFASQLSARRTALWTR